MQRSGWRAGAEVVEMEAAALLAVAQRRGVRRRGAAVRDRPAGGRRPAEDRGRGAGGGRRAARRDGVRRAQLVDASVTVRRSCARGTGSAPGATASRRAARSRAISSSLLPRAPLGACRRRRRGRGAGPVLEPVERVLDALEALGDRPQPAGQALDVGRRRDVQRAHRRLLGLDGLVPRLEGAGERAVHDGVGDQLLGDPPEASSPWRERRSTKVCSVSSVTAASVQHGRRSPSLYAESRLSPSSR